MKGGGLFAGAVMVNPLKNYVPTSEAGALFADLDESKDVRRKQRRAAKHARRVKLGGYYKIKGSDARVLAATGRVPSHASSPEVYIPQKEPLRPEGRRKHRSAQAYRRRQEKREGRRIAAKVLPLLPPDLR